MRKLKLIANRSLGYGNCVACHRNADEDEAKSYLQSLRRGIPYQFGLPDDGKEKSRKKKHHGDDDHSSVVQTSESGHCRWSPNIPAMLEAGVLAETAVRGDDRPYVPTGDC